MVIAFGGIDLNLSGNKFSTNDIQVIQTNVHASRWTEVIRLHTCAFADDEP